MLVSAGGSEGRLEDKGPRESILKSHIAGADLLQTPELSRGMQVLTWGTWSMRNSLGSFRLSMLTPGWERQLRSL